MSNLKEVFDCKAVFLSDAYSINHPLSIFAYFYEF